MKRKNAWLEWEDAIMAELFHVIGPRGLADSGMLPGRTYIAIRSRGKSQGLDASHLRPGPKVEWPEGEPWPVPAHDPREVKDCQLLREWRGPVDPKPAWRIAA